MSNRPQSHGQRSSSSKSSSSMAQTAQPKGESIHVCHVDKLPPGSTFLVKAPDGRNIVVFHTPQVCWAVV